jgi:hypothetical protein
MKLKALAALAFVVLLFSNHVSSVQAASLNEYDEACKYAYENNSVNLECHVGETLGNSAAGSVFYMLKGEPMRVPDQTSDSGYRLEYSGGVTADMGRYIALMYSNKPADTGLYVADLLNGAGIVQPAYAQGLGFASLSPILNTWKVFRNVAYLFFVLIFLVIGFMIMLRQKIGGQTVVTAQQAIPHIVVALIFVTFSYAIAGLLIDGMYLFMFAILALFGHANDANQFVGMNFIGLGFKMVTAGSSAAFDTVTNFAKSAEESLGEFGSEAVGFLGGLTMAVVVAIAIALNVFNLFFLLLKTYVSIVLMIVFSPILLMAGAIPGKNVFLAWVQNLIGNLAAFPAVLLLLIVFDELTFGISGNGARPPIEDGGFLPPYLFGRASGGGAGALTFAVGLGTLLIMPELVKQVKKTMGAKDSIFEQFAGDIGQSLKKGMKGGELIPGIAMSNTNTIPGVGKYLGSGESIVKSGLSLGAGAGAGVAGFATGGVQRGLSYTPLAGDPGPGVARGWYWGKGATQGVAKAVNQKGFGNKPDSGKK